MARMSKSQAKKRLMEAKRKVQAVYVEGVNGIHMNTAVTTTDMAAVEKIIDKCLKRLS